MNSVLQQKVKVTIVAFCEEKNITVTLLVLIFTTVVIAWKRRSHIASLMESLSQATGEISTDFKHRMLGRWAPRNVEQEERVIKRGGYVGGLANDGNTCFMNSILQSLASSKHLLKFLDEEILDAIEAIEEDETSSDAVPEEENENRAERHSGKKHNGKVYGKQVDRKVKAAAANEKTSKPQVDFTVCLKELLDTLNAKHYRNKPFFKTKRLLKTMSKAPNKNIILGYDQEDAQEFFQTLLSEIEKDHQSVHGKPSKGTPESVAADSLHEDAIVGSESLDKIGTVYIPTDQIDPNSVLSDPAKHFTPFQLLTPLDGITAERIGCLQCGENGGIRYSLFSGLSLNLPNDNIGSTLKLTDLLHNWIKPEIIEDVECNRCALMAVYEHLKTKLGQMTEHQGANMASSKLCSLMRTRIERLEEILAKPVIDDEDYKKLHTENMVRKCSKSKQILIARPPPLLSIHINRSVFDPRTFMIRKNNSRVLFKTRLNLTPWCCDINEMNLDARLPMSKKNMGYCDNESSESDPYKAEYYNRLHRKFQAEFEDSEEMEEDEEDDEQDRKGHYPNRDVFNYDPLNGEFCPSSDEEETDMHLEVDALGNTIVKPDPPSVDDVSSEEDIERSTDGDILEKPDNDDEETSDDADADEEDDLKEYPPHSRNDENSRLPPLPELANGPVLSSIPVCPLTYSLRSVVVHYGSHNYGHYIAFRKFRGVWWRISDETVYIVDEAEVLSTPGVFMLFYEYDYNDAAGQLNDDLDYAEDSPSGSEMKDEFESLTGSTKTSVQDELLQE